MKAAKNLGLAIFCIAVPGMLQDSYCSMVATEKAVASSSEAVLTSWSFLPPEALLFGVFGAVFALFIVSPRSVIWTLVLSVAGSLWLLKRNPPEFSVFASAAEHARYGVRTVIPAAFFLTGYSACVAALRCHLAAIRGMPFGVKLIGVLGILSGTLFIVRWLYSPAIAGSVRVYTVAPPMPLLQVITSLLHPLLAFASVCLLLRKEWARKVTIGVFLLLVVCASVPSIVTAWANPIMRIPVLIMSALSLALVAAIAWYLSRNAVRVLYGRSEGG